MRRGGGEQAGVSRQRLGGGGGWARGRQGAPGPPPPSGHPSHAALLSPPSPTPPPAGLQPAGDGAGVPPAGGGAVQPGLGLPPAPGRHRGGCVPTAGGCCWGGPGRGGCAVWGAVLGEGERLPSAASPQWGSNPPCAARCAGEGEDGRMKSAIGIGALLMDGLGDTIRVSLTEDPEYEMDPCSRSVGPGWGCGRLAGCGQGWLAAVAHTATWVAC